MPQTPEEIVQATNDEIQEALRSQEAQAQMRKAEEGKRRQRMIKAASGEDAKLVRVRVTKFGENKVSTGEHKSAFGDVFAAKDTILEVDEDTADELEARGFAEIQD